MRILITVILFSCYLNGLQASKEESKLIRSLLGKYDIHARPVQKSSDVQNVSLEIALHQVIDVEERFQVLTLKLWFRMSWIDNGLIWNKTQFNDIDTITINAEEVWVPDIGLYTDLTDEIQDVKSMYPVSVKFNGEVSWNYPIIMKTFCHLHVDLFPWDSHVCALKFGPWVYDVRQMDLIVNENVDSDVLMRNGEWKIYNMTAKKNIVYYKCCFFPYADITYTITLERKPLYFLFNLALPCSIFTAIALLTFCLPVQSGEKVGLCVTALLAFAVVFQIFSDSMPPQSDSIPLLSIYFGCSLLLMALCLANTVMVISYENRGTLGTPVSPFIRCLVLRCMLRMVCIFPIPFDEDDSKKRYVLDKKNNSISPLEANGSFRKFSNDYVINHTNKENGQDINDGDSETSNTDLKEIKNILNVFLDSQNETNEDDDLENEWVLVASVLDRFFLILYLLLFVALMMSVMLKAELSSLK